MNKVWVVADLELGWNNIVAVYDCNKVSYDDLVKRFPPSGYYRIFEHDVQETVEE
jgi:hypothetical protein